LPGGPQNQVAKDVQQITKVGDQHVNKCEVIADPATTIPDPLLQSFERTATQDAILLGVPLFHGPLQPQTMLGLNAVSISPEQ